MKFKFKQFSIKQDKTAMKVGTDGVLIGAWANCSNAQKILDIGSGTGLISIMLAQRNENAEITGIEIEKDAFWQSLENVEASPWSDRIEIKHKSLQAFAEKTNKKFDLIISNPPFFENSEKAAGVKRNLARHTDSLPFKTLVQLSKKLLRSEGILSVIVPINKKKEFELFANLSDLFLKRETVVKPNITKTPKRVLLEFTSYIGNSEANFLIIEIERHIYTQEYINLTKDFYLKM